MKISKDNCRIYIGDTCVSVCCEECNGTDFIEGPVDISGDDTIICTGCGRSMVV